MTKITLEKGGLQIGVDVKVVRELDELNRIVALRYPKTPTVDMLLKAWSPETAYQRCPWCSLNVLPLDGGSEATLAILNDAEPLQVMCIDPDDDLHHDNDYILKYEGKFYATNHVDLVWDLSDQESERDYV